MSPPRLFITGTDTGVGKTHLACLMARSLRQAGRRVGVYKPVCSGAIASADGDRWDDVDRLGAALGGAFEPELICPQRFRAPLAPPVAAAVESRSVDEALLVSGAARWDGRVEALIVEGAGGWLSPISETMTVADLAVRLATPVLVVAANRLGVINQVLLTLESIRTRALPIAGVVLNQVDAPRIEGAGSDFDFGMSNLQEIEERGRTAVFGILTHSDSPHLVRASQAVSIDWSGLFGAGNSA